MREGEHYGVIPGTDKPSLYKAGAGKLGFTLRLVPEFQVSRRDLPDSHREYEIVCTLRHMGTGAIIGQGVGNCSTLESKYRYRHQEKNTGKPVPKQYFSVKKKDPKKAQMMLGGYGFRPRKIDSQWLIVTHGERVENPDIADVFNTVLKMAKKRAHVDAIIATCAASDIFAQDLEDFVHDEPESVQPGQKPAKDPGRQSLINKIGELMKSLLFTDDERDAIKKAGDKKALVQIKEKCKKVLEIREMQAREQADESELNRIANEGWEE